MKHTGKLLLVFLAAMFVMPFAMAAVNITTMTPATASLLNGTYNFSVNVTSNTLVGNISWYYSTDSGTTWTFFTSRANGSADQVTFSKSYDTAGLPDNNAALIINATAYSYQNGTNYTNSTTISGNRVDNTAPTVTFNRVTATPIPQMGVTKVQCIVSDTGSGVANLAIKINYSDPKAITKNFTGIGNLSTNYLSISGQDNQKLGTYTVSCVAIDLSGQETTQTVTYKAETTGKAQIIDSDDGASSGNNNKIFILILAILVIYFITNQKK